MTHPVTGIQRKFDAVIYESIKLAILQSLKGSRGKTFTQLADDVEKIIHIKMPDFKKSIPWYTISIRQTLKQEGLWKLLPKEGKS